MSNGPRFLRIASGDNEGLYEIKSISIAGHLDNLPQCPCCEQPLQPGYDVCQWGMFEDKYWSYLLCRACGHAFEAVYTVPTYDLVSKTKQKRWGLLSTSKVSPAEPGSGALCKRHTWEHHERGYKGPKRCVVCGAINKPY